MSKALLPLAIFIALLVVLGLELRRDPSVVPSPLIDKPAPVFQLPTLAAPETVGGTADLRGQVWLLNVWASWCVSCRQEHPVLLDFAKTQSVPIVGLNYKDKRDDALGWLARFGNPYSQTLVDAQGAVGIDFGVYAVPESFLIDRAGVIRYKQIGPITPEVLRDTLVPLIARLKAS